MKQKIFQLYKRKEEFIDLLIYLFAFPVILTTCCIIFGKIASLITQFTTLQSLYTKGIVYQIRTFYPLVNIYTIITALCTPQKRKHRAVVAVSIPIMLALSWFCGGSHLLKIYQNEMDKQLQSAISYGAEFKNLKLPQKAKQYYKRAILLDKYIVLWNDNTDIPMYFCEIAVTYAGSDPLTAEKYYNKSLKAIKKYASPKLNTYAYINLQAALTSSALGKNEIALQQLIIAGDYYKNNLETVDSYTAGTAFTHLANAYYNNGEYQKASDYFELGIPIYYASINWGFNDEMSARFVAAFYKTAAQTYQMLNNQEKCNEYTEKYNDFLWFRDIPEEYINSIINYYHWLNH